MCAHLGPATGHGTVDVCGENGGSIADRGQPPCAGRAYFPRRSRVDKFTPAETAIRAALQAVETVGADVRLTDAVVLLGHAADRLADFVENQPSREITGLPAREPRKANG